jgi:hypothetical protein
MPSRGLDAARSESRSGMPYAIAIIAGMALWFAASSVAGKREAWDAGIYWSLFYPLAIGACGLLGYLFPERPWRWAIALFLAQCVAMVLRSGEIGSLFPLGVIMFGVLSLPGIAVAQLGAKFHGRRAD